MNALADGAFASAYHGKTVFLTGHTGFKGAWLALWLERLGARVVGYSLPAPTEPSLFGLAGLAGSLEHHEADVRDATALRTALERARPDFVFHLAAQPLVRQSYRMPLETLGTNVMGTANLLETLRVLGQPCAVVAVTTDKVYENREWVYGYRESDPLGGHDPYSASKAAAELVVGAYRQSFFPPEQLPEHGVALATARAGNVIGGGDWSPDRIVPDAVRARAAAEALDLRNPGSVRPWQHVLEPLSGYLWLGARLASSEGARYASAWNLGPRSSDERTVGELAAALAAAWGEQRPRFAAGPPGPHEAGLLKLTIDKARAELGWTPVWDFAVAVERTARWYAERAAGQSARSLCLADLAAYEGAARAAGLEWAAGSGRLEPALG